MPAAAADSAEPSCVVYVDAGTTNTRVWLAKDQKILARETATVGVRDTARDKSAHKLRAALTNLIREVSQGAPQNKPRCVIASGMITSSLGLAEVPHITAPAGLRELAAGVEFHRFADITDLPFLLVPGVRCGPPNAAEVENIGEVDLMRGEETLCIGLIESGMLNSHSALLNLGSHWKAIKVDDDQRIQQSVTRLTGEMIQAVQEHTVLASAVTQEKPTTLDEAWLIAGMREQRRSGLERALFCVRLLEQENHGTPDDRLSYLIGAFISSSLDSMVRTETLAHGASVVITGSAAIAAGWAYALTESGMSATCLSSQETEQALLKGLHTILSVCLRGSPTHRIE